MSCPICIAQRAIYALHEIATRARACGVASTEECSVTYRAGRCFGALYSIVELGGPLCAAHRGQRQRELPPIKMGIP